MLNIEKYRDEILKNGLYCAKKKGNVTVDKILDAYVTTEDRLYLKNTHIERRKI